MVGLIGQGELAAVLGGGCVRVVELWLLCGVFVLWGELLLAGVPAVVAVVWCRFVCGGAVAVCVTSVRER